MKDHKVSGFRWKYQVEETLGNVLYVEDEQEVNFTTYLFVIVGQI
jgi:hypothetical protein